MGRTWHRQLVAKAAGIEEGSPIGRGSWRRLHHAISIDLAGDRPSGPSTITVVIMEYQGLNEGGGERERERENAEWSRLRNARRP